MNVFLKVVRNWVPLTAALALAALVGGCASSNPRMPAAGERDADKYLFDRGTEALGRKRWLEAREYFRKLIDTYPTSRYREDARLGVGDSFLGEGRSDSLILAANEFREFLNYFPLAPRADYAQYHLALSVTRQVLAPQRDQTATRDALRELDTFVRVYPTSALMPEVLKLQRQTRDRLSESEFLVGQFYYRSRNYPGAVIRLKALSEADPGYTHRDAVYYYLGASLEKLKQPQQALPYYERLVTEFASSEYLDKAKERVEEIKKAPPMIGGTPGAAAAAGS